MSTTASPTGRRLGSVFARSVHDERRSLIGWVLGVLGLAVWLLAMFPTISGNTDMQKLLAAYPEAVRAMFHLDDFTTGPGYLRSEVFSFTVPVLMCILGVLWGSDAVAGEEERGTLDLLLANPIRRRRLVVEKAAAVLVGIAAVALVLGLVLVAGGPIVGLDVPVGRLAAAVVATALLAACFGALALAIGAATGRRGLARGLGAVAVVGAYLVSSLASLVSWLRPLRTLSPWHHALGIDPLGTGWPLGHFALLAAGAVGFVLAGAAMFERRDLLH